MSELALIVAAHGSDKDPAVNERIRRLAAEAAALAGYDVGIAAFHQGSPAYADALDECQSDHAVVVPLMTSDGYYCETILPRELPKNKRYESMFVHKTGPVGTHPAIVPLVESRAERLLSEHGVSPKDTALAIVGHGTERYVRSRIATEHLASAIGDRSRFQQVLIAFLDENPAVGTITERATAANIVVEPFLISDAYHANTDVPRGVGLTADSGTSGPTVGRVGDHFILCDTAVGSDDGILGVIIARAVHGRSVLTRRIAGAA